MSDETNKPGVIGPTGRYPLGRGLTDTDQGGLKMSVSTYGKQVILEFGTPVAWVGLTPDNAEALTRTIMQKVTDLRRGGH